MDQDIRSIMDLVAKGIISPEEGEKMIQEINKRSSFTENAKEQARTLGDKIGGGIDKIAPKTKSIIKKGFDATAEFSQKMSDKLDEDKKAVNNATTEFNEKMSSKFEEDKKTVNDATTEFTEKVSTKFEEDKKAVNDATTEFTQKVSSEFEEDKKTVTDATAEFTQKVSSEFEENKKAVTDATTEFTEKVSTKFEEGKKAVDEDLDKLFKKDEEVYVNENPDFPDLKEIETIFEDAGDEVEPSSEEVIDLVTLTQDVVQEAIEEIIDLEKDDVQKQ